ncbi:MAG: DinB family protein [Dehalococcoidia bacterium]|nr:DinB family protein [Dehalococcoidia bacterium]
MGQPTEAQRVRGYILTQANKLTIPELVSKVRTDTAPLREAAASVPEDRFFDRPASEDWSAAEVFTHILDMNDRGADAIQDILDSARPLAAVADCDDRRNPGGLKHAEDFWQAYLAKREPLLERVLLARGMNTLRSKSGPRFGDLTWREWLLFMRVHDLDHMRQLQTNAAHFGG